LKALLVGDIHIDNSKSSIANSDSFHEIFKTFDLIKESIFKYRPDFVIFFGDVFNSPYSITSPVITIISEIIAEIAMDVTVIFIVGNHDDVDDKTSSVKIGDRYLKIRASLLAPFSHYPNVIVFDSPKVVKIQSGIEVAFIPYSTNIIPSLDLVDNKFTRGCKRILIGHFDMKQSYYMIKSHDSIITNNIPSAEDLIRKYKYDLVLLGHVHDPSEYDIDGKKAKYIGSCRNVDFRNTGEMKGIYIFDFDTLDMQYIDNPNTSIYKVFNNFKSIQEYCLNNDPEKISRTKVLYKYTENKDAQKISKLKEYFKSVQFEKNILAESNTINTISMTMAQEFENMITNNLITKDKLLDYAIQFKPPANKDSIIEVFKLFSK
jgi:DNA repair exonuclease SbcCD nuclease subunit